MTSLTANPPQTKRRRLTPTERQARNAEALNRAQSGSSEKNEMIAELWATDAGYPSPQARVNILTYAAWRALGRQVRKGEHGCKLETWIPCGPEPAPNERDENGKLKRRAMRRKLTTVFHEAQTDAVA